MYNYYAGFDNQYILEEINPQKIKLKKAIISYACGSMYRMNAASADCYAFSYDNIGDKYLDGTTCKKIDFSGGWDWSEHLVDTNCEYIYKFSDKKFYKVVKAKK